MQKVRNAIEVGTFEQLREEFVTNYKIRPIETGGGVPAPG
jgi:queuine/archaeosine tRNA-ribosyltransferase